MVNLLTLAYIVRKKFKSNNFWLDAQINDYRFHAESWARWIQRKSKGEIHSF